MTFKRQPLPTTDRDAVSTALQPCLCDLVDLALLLKQAHWTLKGERFLSIHEQLDGIIDDVREAVDDIAERMAQIGVAPDGRSRVVAEHARLEPYPGGFVDVPECVTLVSDRLARAAKNLRDARDAVAEPDPITEDLLIDKIGELEEHLWMLQAQEA